MNEHLNDAKKPSTLGVWRPITAGEHAAGCSVRGRRIRHRLQEDTPALLQPQMKLRAFSAVQNMNIYEQKIPGLTSFHQDKVLQNCSLFSVLKNYEAISKTLTLRGVDKSNTLGGASLSFSFKDKFIQGNELEIWRINCHKSTERFLSRAAAVDFFFSGKRNALCLSQNKYWSIINYWCLDH